jgi:hypothetical protein
MRAWIIALAFVAPCRLVDSSRTAVRGDPPENALTKMEGQVTPTHAPVVLPTLLSPVSIQVTGTPTALSAAQVAEIETVMKTTLAMGAGYGLDCNPCYEGDLYGAILRLVFHDAAGQESRLDGCVDFNEPDHNGLQEITGQLQAVWDKVGGAAILSFADLTAIASKVAVEMASTVSKFGDPGKVSDDTIINPLILPLKFGRIDALICNDEGLLPPSSFSWGQTSGLFKTRFGLDETESVALMGAHALGRAELRFSGVSDMGWTDYQSSFGNRYFTDMIGISWRLSDQFDVFEKGKVMLLRADTELAISSQADCVRWDPGPEQKEGICPLNVPTLPVVRAFGGKGGTFLWWTHFEAAFTKMVEANNPDLYSAV